jgi:RimJ/RimL family protein N-acetyltransferase
MSMSAIRLAGEDDAAAVVAHFDRHIAESGVGETPVFTPLPAGQAWHDAGLAGQLQVFWQRSLTLPGWGRCWIVEDGPDVVGALVLRGSSLPTGMHRATLAMGLEAPYRGQGLGRALMQASMAWADQQPELAWIDLRVFAHNTPGLRLYNAFGFTEIGRVNDFIRVDGQVIDDILMARPTRVVG